VSLLAEVTTTTTNAGDGPFDVSVTTDGSGSGAVLTVTCTSGVISAVSVKTQGSGYAVGDTLTIPTATISGSTAGVVTLRSVGAGGKLGLCNDVANGYRGVTATSGSTYASTTAVDVGA